MLSRSLLFVPADQETMISKVNQLEADIILLDLEDAVAIETKPAARDLLKKHIQYWHRPVFIRINSIETTDFLDDMTFIKSLGNSNALQGFMLPKASSKEDIEKLAQHLEDAEQYNQLDKTYLILPLIESAAGVKKAHEIAVASERITRLAFGGVDFTHDIGAQDTPQEHELLYARSEIVISSRVANIKKPIDTVYTHLKDSEGFRQSSSYAKSLGFGGKLLIHPAQIEPANDVFSPTDDEISFAKELVKHAEAQAGTFQLNGKMIDRPVIEKAYQVLEDEKAINNG
ncbi:HpcH/HpaI aldolase/citrate lyase family protein [Tuberibacillus sp. Marseille-P3662]|uniref:HpcH/HpaI aldolase/citrate lyase family protein n=1 Tax=Tuberibacillus sp. Marseille-P3662 TaxID=1965358 RepID=UPI000A1CCC22|nr:CoA ester lyase [Tuberibacillus sp. Marseille-P3662]